jgi:tRNA A-37 threonylcarbamoyl transferase component Bud32
VDSIPRLNTEQVGRIAWTTRSDVPAAWWRSLLSAPDAHLADPASHLKHSRNVTVARIPADEPRHANLILRRSNYGRWEHRLKDFLRRSRAQRAFRAALALEQAGLPVARALAVGEVRLLRWPVQAYLLSLEVGDAVTLTRYVAGRSRVPRGIEKELARLLGQLHAAGFTHGDLKSSNVLIQGAGKPWLIDFDGVRSYRRVPFGRAVRDLARLGAGIIEAGGRCTLPMVVRFLRGYCATRGLTDWRAWYRAVAPRIISRVGARAMTSGGRAVSPGQASGVAENG